MSGLMTAALLIVTFLVLVLVLRVVGGHIRAKRSRDTDTDN